MSFLEKSIWITLGITILVYGFYFFQAVAVFTNPLIPDESIIGLFIVATVIIIILQIVFQSILAIANRKEAEKDGDERDELIELKATRLSYFILAAGVWISGLLSLAATPLIMANLLLFFFVIAELVGYIKQLVHYRRGV